MDMILRILRNMMQEKVVKFSYLKSDGSTRIAFGTLNSECIDTYKPKSSTDTKRPPHRVPDGMFLYFDIEKLSWRMFAHERFIGIDYDYD